jgi:hypothetical protein
MSHAGELPETIYTGRRAARSVGQLDREDIRTVYCDLLNQPVSVMQERTARLRRVTWRLLRIPAVWAAVRRVAEALIRRNVLTAHEVRTACCFVPKTLKTNSLLGIADALRLLPMQPTQPFSREFVDALALALAERMRLMIAGIGAVRPGC